MARWSYSFQADYERTGADGERDCARAEWCASATRERQDDGTTSRIPASGPRAFCDADAAVIAEALRSFPDTWRRLWPELERITGEVLVRVPFGPSVPVRTDVDDVMRTMVDCALSWHERVATVDPTLTPPGGDDGTGDTREWHSRSLGRHAPGMLEDSSRRLAERVTVLLGLQPDTMMRPELVASLGCGTVVTDAGRSWQRAVALAAGLQPGSCDWLYLVSRHLERPAGTVFIDAGGAAAGLEVLRLDYVARAVMLETNPDLDVITGVQCEQCGRKSLRRALPPMHEGDTAYYASCDDCRALYTDEEFGAWTDHLTRFYARLVTPAALSRAGLRGDETPAIATAAAA